MQDKTDMLGDVIKNARLQAEVTMEALAERVGVTERYLYRIENEGKIPSYDVLNKLIRELSIDPYLIHFPERQAVDDEIGALFRMLCSCDERALEVIKAMARVLIDTNPEK